MGWGSGHLDDPLFVRETVLDAGHAIITNVLDGMRIKRVVFFVAASLTGEALDLEASEEVIIGAGLVALVVGLAVITAVEEITLTRNRVNSSQAFYS